MILIHDSRCPAKALIVRNAVIVFGALVRKGGEPSPSLRRRAVHGASMVLTGEAPVLIATGGISKYPPSEASVIRRLAIEEGVPETKIILDETSFSTLDSALTCANIMNRHGWTSAWVVSDSYHLPRCVFLLRQLGVLAQGSAPDHSGSGTTRLNWYYLCLRELLAFPWSLLRIWFFHKRSAGSAWRTDNCYKYSLVLYG